MRIQVSGFGSSEANRYAGYECPDSREGSASQPEPDPEILKPEHLSHYALPRYSPVSVETRICSPVLMKGGTRVFRPVSQVASLS